MIYRAICYCTHDWMENIPESIVFIQGRSPDTTAARLSRVLADIWNVPIDSVEFYNLNDELELFANTLGGLTSGDARFFEIGSRGAAPLYWDKGAPLLLLEPEANERLSAAWKSVCAMRCIPASPS